MRNTMRKLHLKNEYLVLHQSASMYRPEENFEMN